MRNNLINFKHSSNKIEEERAQYLNEINLKLPKGTFITIIIIKTLTK